MEHFWNVTTVYVLQAESREVPGRLMYVFSTHEKAEARRAELRTEFGRELEYCSIQATEVDA